MLAQLYETVSSNRRSLRLHSMPTACVQGGPLASRCGGRPSRGERAEAAQAEASAEPAVLPTDPLRRIAELERKIGEQRLAPDFFSDRLRHVRERRQANAAPGGTASTR